MSSGDRRVHQVAKELGLTAKEVRAKLAEIGVTAKSPSSTVKAEDINRLLTHGTKTAPPPATVIQPEPAPLTVHLVPAFSAPHAGKGAQEAQPTQNRSHAAKISRKGSGTTTKASASRQTEAPPESSTADVRRPSRNSKKKLQGPSRAAARLTRLAEKQAAADRAYRAALKAYGSELPKTLGTAEGHGGAQPQVGSRKRGTKVLPSKQALPKRKRS